MEHSRGAASLQTHESVGVLNAPAGKAGVAGSPEQKAPEQGRVGRGADDPSDGAAGPATEGFTIDGSRPGSVREMTRCPQPARAEPGPQKT
jgi:hypothetical protein